jgi:hypothetical protein
MIKLVGYLVFILSLSANALVPVEGIILGEAKENLQTDPLRAIFSDIYNKSDVGEIKKLKLYLSTYTSGQNLQESCSYLNVPRYLSPWSEKHARRTAVATLQYIGLDTSIKAIGAYARKLNLDAAAYKNLRANIVANYCSRNISVISLKSMDKALDYYYQNPIEDLIPSIKSSPFGTELSRRITDKEATYSKQFDLAIRNFRAFCSWGNDVDDYRMLTPYLNNRFIMSFVIKNLSGIQDQIDDKLMKVSTVPSSSTVQVTCRELICRKDNYDSFKLNFPLSVGSTGIFTDLTKIYCHHFRYQDQPKKTAPQVEGWLKSYELEDPIFETSQFISLMTGVPDFLYASDSFREVPLLVRSSIDERWTSWASRVIDTFSRDMLYEESLKVKIEPEKNFAALSSRGFEVGLSVTLGEMDRILEENDKLKVKFHLSLSKNYLRSLRDKARELDQNVDEVGRKALEASVASYINLQLKEKQKYFTQKMWNEDFAVIIADELIRLSQFYRGSLFDSYKDEMLRVPIKFSYGLFALSYIRYRANVAAGRLKLNL